MPESLIQLHIRRLKEETQKLTDLLDKPQWGLVTWAEAVCKQIEVIHSFLIIKGRDEYGG